MEKKHFSISVVLCMALICLINFLVWDAPWTSGWVLYLLVAGAFALMASNLRLGWLNKPILGLALVISFASCQGSTKSSNSALEEDAMEEEVRQDTTLVSGDSSNATSNTAAAPDTSVAKSNEAQPAPAFESVTEKTTPSAAKPPAKRTPPPAKSPALTKAKDEATKGLPPIQYADPLTKDLRTKFAAVLKDVSMVNASKKISVPQQLAAKVSTNRWENLCIQKMLFAHRFLLAGKTTDAQNKLYELETELAKGMNGPALKDILYSESRKLIYFNQFSPAPAPAKKKTKKKHK